MSRRRIRTAWRLAVLLCGVVLAAASWAAVPALLPEETRQGWLQLLDGETTFGWTPSSPGWKVDKGILSSSGSAENRLRTNSAFANFDLKFEARASGLGPASLTFRLDPGSKPQQPGYRLTLNDGGIAGLRSGQARLVTSDWNTYEIFALEDHLTSTVNGKLVLDARDNKNRIGYLEFLAPAGTKLEIRSVKLRPLKLDSIYNGTNLDGWKSVDAPTPQQQGSKLKLPLPGLSGKPKPQKNANWTGQDMIHGEGGVGRLETANAYDDFILQLSVKSNGGGGELFLRGDAGQFASGYTLKIDNSADGNRKPHNVGTGGLPKLQAARLIAAKNGEFFTETVIARARRIAVWVNGLQVTDYYDSRPEGSYRGGAGPFGFRIGDSHAKFDFRDISVAVLSKGLQPPQPPAPAVAGSPGSPDQKAQQEQRLRSLTEQALAAQTPEEAVRINREILLLDPNDVPAQQRLDKAQEKLDKQRADQAQAEQQQQDSAAKNQATLQRKDELVRQAQESIIAGNLNAAERQLDDARRLGASGQEFDRLNIVVKDRLRDRMMLRACLGAGAFILLVSIATLFWRRRGRTLTPYLIAVDGMDTGKRYFIGQEVTHLGAIASDAGKTNQVVVRDPDRLVSRFHCEVHRRGNSFYLIDLNSANGTFLRNTRLKPGVPLRLKNGDRISLANVAAFELSLERVKASSGEEKRAVVA